MLEKALLSTVSVDFCYYSEKYSANLFILSLLLSWMISAYTLHKFIKAFPHMFTMLSLYLVKFVRLDVILLLLLFPGKVTAWENLFLTDV